MPPTSRPYDVVLFGATGFTGGLMFGSLLAKYDHHEVEFDAVTTGFDEKSDGSTWGIEGEIGRKGVAPQRKAKVPSADGTPTLVIDDSDVPIIEGTPYSAGWRSKARSR